MNENENKISRHEAAQELHGYGSDDEVRERPTEHEANQARLDALRDQLQAERGLNGPGTDYAASLERQIQALENGGGEDAEEDNPETQVPKTESLELVALRKELADAKADEKKWDDKAKQLLDWGLEDKIGIDYSNDMMKAQQRAINAHHRAVDIQSQIDALTEV